MKALSLNLTDAQALQLKQAALALRCSKSALIRQALDGVDFLAIGRRRLEELEAVTPSSRNSSKPPARRRTLLNAERTSNARLRNLTLKEFQRAAK
jgi:hypothetical protein